jgi:hypothetical protein
MASILCSKEVRSLLCACVLVTIGSVPAVGQSPDPPLQGRSLSVSGALGGPAGGYTIGVEHLFVRTPTLQVGMRGGGSYAHDLVWDGTATAFTAGALVVRRIGMVGDRPLAVEGGLGATRVHEDFSDDPRGSLLSRTGWYVYASSAFRIPTMNGRLTYRIGATLLHANDDPFVVPLLGIGVGLF